ncbi:glycerate kinase type-2 family protein [Hominifimenecus sp. rT4P-3]|uniref:glycerate kinase type-2 family protein n=1 Tax=Hominifimenecus sp. rT4P-3 TaxID=3242979 RepID=UPI003DA2B808
MEPAIRNKKELLSAGDVESRKIILEAAERTLRMLNAEKRIESIFKREGSVVSIGAKSWDLAQKRNVYLIGAGKACNAMAMAVEHVLGEYLTDGIAIVKIAEDSDDFKKTRVYVGGHPVPNEAGLSACREVQKMIDGANEEDIFFCVMSGGSSALMGCPLPGITLEEEARTTDILLKSGANIREINAVRRHISAMNGGRMAQKIADKRAELVGFNISDSVAYGPTKDISIPWENFSATPMGPDHTTLEDAIGVIRDYALEDRLPASVTRYLKTCGPEGETPKAFPQNTYYQIDTLPDSCVFAMQAAEQMGIPAIVLTTYLEGEAEDAGRFMAAIARQIQQYGQPVKAPCLVFCAGEVVTTITDNRVIRGHGGPSHEMALGFAAAAEKIPGACFLSIDSEGTDGTTPAAGGIADSKTMAALEAAGIHWPEVMRSHASHEALKAIGGAVFTGNTGTNVCDFNILYVPEGVLAERK